jgi:dTMP kinase
MKGAFIAIEGLDGSGGTTQVRMLVDAVPGALSTAEPSTGPIGKLIRAALAGQEPLGDGVLPYLFAADRRDHLDREIGPAVAQGRLVVTDRYYHSSLAYQSLAAPLGRVAQLNEDFRAPDVTIFLDLSIDDCLERITARGQARDRFETRTTLEQVSAAYGAALALLAGRGERIVPVDASGTPDQVHKRVMIAVAEFLT